MALRAALGASRGRILRQLLTESVALSLLGGGLGIALALGALSGLKAALPADARGFSAVGIDAGVLAFVTGLSVLCGLVFGLAPAASASRVDLAASMKAGGPRAMAPGGTRLRGSFITAEVGAGRRPCRRRGPPHSHPLRADPGRPGVSTGADAHAAGLAEPGHVPAAGGLRCPL